VAYSLSFTTEEWAAAIAALELPEPLGLDGITGPPDGEPDSAALAVGARSLLGRGLFDPSDSDRDVHPLFVGLLLALLEAEEVVVVTTAYPGATTTNGWYVVGATGVSMSQDPLTNLRFRVAPANEVIAQAKDTFAQLATAAPAREQYPVEPSDLRAVLESLTGEDQPSPVLRTGGTSRPVSFLASIRGWTREGQDVVESSLFAVGLTGHGNWVVDDGGGVPVLTQMRSPWPDALNRFTA
jgi:hypothetical protein